MDDLLDYIKNELKVDVTVGEINLKYDKKTGVQINVNKTITTKKVRGRK